LKIQRICVENVNLKTLFKEKKYPRQLRS